MVRKEYTTVSIPKTLYDKVNKQIEGTGFTSVSDYVVFVLRELVTTQKEETSFDKEDQDKIKERLRSLGYLD